MSERSYVKDIISDLDRLEDRSDEVSPTAKKKDIKRIVKELEATLKNSKYVALAAPQIGYKKRIFSLKFNNEEIRTFVNPMITYSSDELIISRETCASLVKKQYIIPRNKSISVMYQTKDGNIVENKFEDLAAAYFQQMYQLLDGVLLNHIDNINGRVYSLALEIPRGFDSASDEDKQAVIELYLKDFKEYEKLINNQINNDKNLKAEQDAMRLMKEVALGNVEIVPIKDDGDLDFSKSSKLVVDAEKREDEMRKQLIEQKIKEIKERENI